MKTSADRITRYIPALLTTLLWGSMGIPASYAVKELQPLLLLAARSLIAVLFLSPLVLFRYGTMKTFKGDKRYLFLLGIIGVLLNNYFYFFALQHTSLTNCAVIFASSPIITALLSALLLKEPFRQSRVLGMIVAFCGVAMLLTKGHSLQIFSTSINIGDIAQFFSAFCASMLAILGKKIRHTPPECVVLWQMIIGGFSALTLYFISGGVLPQRLSNSTLWSLAYLGILCSSVGYLSLQLSVKSIGAAASSAFLNGIPPITLLTASLILHEKPSCFQLVCMAIIFVGIFFNARNQTFFRYSLE